MAMPAHGGGSLLLGWILGGYRELESMQELVFWSGEGLAKGEKKSGIHCELLNQT